MDEATRVLTYATDLDMGQPWVWSGPDTMTEYRKDVMTELQGETQDILSFKEKEVWGENSE